MRVRFFSHSILGFIDEEMVVSTAGSFKLVHSDGGVWGQSWTHRYEKWNENNEKQSNKKNLQSDDLPYAADTSRIQTSQKPKLKIKKS